MLLFNDLLLGRRSQWACDVIDSVRMSAVSFSLDLSSVRKKEKLIVSDDCGISAVDSCAVSQDRDRACVWQQL